MKHFTIFSNQARFLNGRYSGQTRFEHRISTGGIYWRKSLILLSALLFFSSCGRNMRNAVTNDVNSTQSGIIQTLPSGYLTMSGDASFGSWPGQVATVYGGPDGMLPGEKDLSLMHFLLVSGPRFRTHRRTDTGPNLMRFEWIGLNTTNVTLAMSYDPTAHGLDVLGKRYLLGDGNFFLIALSDDGDLKFQQVAEKHFEYKSPKEAFSVFKAHFPDVKLGPP